MAARGDDRDTRTVARHERRRPAETETGVDVARRLAPGTLLAGRYRIVAVAGLGGMGIVYKAHDEEIDQDVALKVLRPDLGSDPEWVDRFRRELVLAREVTHRNVVRIHDIGDDGGLRFLTMRYVEGRSLLEILDASGSLPLPRVLRIVRQVAEALADAHAAGVVHRDLKPGNILLEADDTAYVTDFGVARSLSREGLTEAGVVVGTPDYLSPEQVAGDPVDGRSDLYALGILFYEMLTGQLPFRGGSQAEVLAQRLTGHVRDMDETGVRVPAWVRAVVRRCLERSPARRYQTAREILVDLDRQAAGAGVASLRVKAAVVLVAAALAGWGAWRWHEARTPTGSPGAPAEAAREAPPGVALLPLADETADAALAWTSAGLPEMLAAQLAESPDLRVVDPFRVLRTLKDLQLERGPYDDAVLRRLSELLDAPSLVTGSVRRAGSALRVDLRLLSLESGGSSAVRALSAESAAPAALFDAVRDLGGRLRAELGAAVEEAPPDPVTSSLEAARAYRDGRDRMLVGDFVGAAPPLERAVAADASFAAALEQLAAAYGHLGYEGKAVEAAERAARIVGAEQTRLAHRVRARLARLRGDPAEAERAYASLLQRYPNDAEALLDLAAAQAERGENAHAVATLDRATRLDRADPRAWFLLGKNMILVGDAGKAVGEPLLRALALQTQLHNEQGRADVLNAMGVAYQRLGDYPQAIEKYSAAAEVRERLGDARGTGTSLRNRASLRLAMGRYDEAEPDLRAARRIYERIGDPRGLAEVWNDFGALHEGRGDYTEARKAYQEALSLRRSLGDDRQIAQSYDNLGYVFFVLGDYDSSLVYWKQALELRRRIGEKSGVVLSLQNMGFLDTAQGRWSEAMKLFLEALDRSREIDFKNALAVSHGNIGLLHHYEGRYSAAFASWAEALALLAQLDDKRGLAEFTLKETAALLDLARLDEARERLARAEPWVRETGNREQAADLRAALGEWHLRRGDAGAARSAFAEAVEQARASHSRPALLRARIAQATAEAQLGSPGPAAATLRSSLAEAESLGDALLRIRAAEGLARAEAARRRPREAEEAARRALKVAERCGWEAGLWRLHALLARVRADQGDAAGAAQHAAESARRIAKIRGGMDDASRAAFGTLPEVQASEAAKAGTPATGRPPGGR